MGYIAGRDHRIMRRVHNWLPPRWFRAWMVLSTRGGDGWLWYAMGAVVALFGGSSRAAALGAGAAAAGAAIGLYSCLKRAVGRKRPCDIEPHRWADLLPPDRFSFPSGHSMLAFAITVPLSLFYPAASAALIFCALSVSASRILLGMHFLSDVVAGGVMGGALGYAAYSFFSPAG
jgi:undecaprenyl-diphosphatase